MSIINSTLHVGAICHKVKTASAWAQDNSTVLQAGELGIESDTLRIKTGDGVHTWPELVYTDGGIMNMISGINTRLNAIEANLGNLNTLAQSQLQYLNSWSGQLEEEEK